MAGGGSNGYQSCHFHSSGDSAVQCCAVSNELPTPLLGTGCGASKELSLYLTLNTIPHKVDWREAGEESSFRTASEKLELLPFLCPVILKAGIFSSILSTSGTIRIGAFPICHQLWRGTFALRGSTADNQPQIASRTPSILWWSTLRGRFPCANIYVVLTFVAVALEAAALHLV